MIQPISRIARTTATLGRFALASLTFVACSNDVDNTPNKLPYADAGPGAQGDGSAGVCGCMKKGQVFRFDSLQIVAIDRNENAGVIPQLNPIWLADITRHELNFFLELEDVKEDEVTLNIINGARTDGQGDTCAVASTKSTVRLLRNGCEFTNFEPADGGYTFTADPAALNVYAGTPANPKNCAPVLAPPNVIALRNAAFRGRMSETCDEITDGTLAEGSIPKTTVEGTCTCLLLGDHMAEECSVPDPTFKREGTPNDINACAGCNKNYQSLNSLLITFNSGKPLEYLCKDEKGYPAVCLSATFHALTSQMPAACDGTTSDAGSDATTSDAPAE